MNKITVQNFGADYSCSVHFTTVNPLMFVCHELCEFRKWLKIANFYGHPPTEVRTLYRQPWIVMLLESLQQNKVAQRHL